MTAEDLLARALAALDTGGVGAVDDLLAAHPEHAARVRGYLERLGRLGLVDDTSPGDGEFPAELGEFALRRRLGGGGMGVVYEAEQRSLGRVVALKLIRPEHLYFPGARERFRREVAAIARLQHPGIVPVFDAGEDQGVPWLAMEHVVGASLDEVLQRLAGRDPTQLRGHDLRDAVLATVAARDPAAAAAPRDATATGPATFAGSWTTACLRIARTVAEALQHAHERGVLHRDVKPSNVVLLPDGRALLLDFGLARTDDAVPLTGSGSPLGSPAYMSPEQVRGDAAATDARTDVYSLGVTLYELLTLRVPFAGESREGIRERVLAGRPEPPRTLNPAVPVDAEVVCLCAMDPDATRRYRDARGFADDLGCVLELRPIRARAAGWPLLLRRWVQRHPTLATALVAAALLVVLVPSALWWQQRAANERIGAALVVAERDRDRAREAVDTMLTRVADETLFELPRMQQVRRDLLASAHAFYERLLTDGGDGAATGEAARAALRLARLDYELGRAEPAQRSADRAVELARAAARVDPAAASTLAEALDARAQTRAWLGQLEAALPDVDEAIGRFEAQAQSTGGVAASLRGFGVRASRAALLSQLGRRDEAAGAYAELRGTAAALLGAARGTPHADEALGRVLSGLASEAALLQRLGRADGAVAPIAAAASLMAGVDVDALPVLGRLACARLRLVQADADAGAGATEAHLRAALAILAALLDDHPDHANALRIDALARSDLGVFCRDDGRAAEAEALFTAAAGRLRRLLAIEPNGADVRGNLAATLCNLGATQRDRGDGVAALAAFAEAEALATAANEALPKRQDFALFRYNATWFHAEALGATGDGPGQVAAAERLAALRPDDARTQRIAAGFVAAALGGEVAAGRAAPDGWGERAVALLHAAARLGCPDVELVRDEAPFTLLRGIAGFADVVAAMAANAAAGASGPR